MKIVHVYSRNLGIFEDAIKGTSCCLHGSNDATYLRNSLLEYNVRDVLGLIIFQQYITKRTLRLLKAFDDFFVFDPRPAVVVCDGATALYEAKKIKVRHSPLYLVDSIDGTISDVDLQRIFTTLVCESGDLYDLRDVERAHGLGGYNRRDVSELGQTGVGQAKKEAALSDVSDILNQLNKLGV